MEKIRIRDGINLDPELTSRIRNTDSYSILLIITFSVSKEASAPVGHIEDPHLERVIWRAGDEQRLAGQRAHSAHGAAMRVTHLRRQLPLLQVPERDMARRGPAQKHRKSCAATVLLHNHERLKHNHRVKYTNI
jgi:hypothetical protein